MQKKSSFHVDETLHKQCTKSHSCYSTPISWNTAYHHCLSMGIDLPSVHSTRDMQTIRNIVLKNQYETFIHKVTNERQCIKKPHWMTIIPDRQKHIFMPNYTEMYEAIGIVIGLNFWVCTVKI